MSESVSTGRDITASLTWTMDHPPWFTTPPARCTSPFGPGLADNGCNWYFTGTSEPGWDTNCSTKLKAVPAGEFEAVETASLMSDPNSARVASGSAPAAGPSVSRSSRRWWLLASDGLELPLVFHSPGPAGGLRVRRRVIPTFPTVAPLPLR